MKYRYRKQNEYGYTLAELLIVVGILSILLSLVSVGVLKIRKELRQKALDAKAETIYVAVQNKLSKMKASGNTAIYKYDEDAPGNGVVVLPQVPSDAAEEDQIKSGDLCRFTSLEREITGTAAMAVMDEETVDGQLLKNHWVVEYNPSSAVVYAVFYSEDRGDCASEYQSVYDKYDFNLRYKQQRLADGARVGYYGGGSATSSEVTTLVPQINVTNAEKLVADFSCMLPTNISDYPVFKLELSDTEGNTFTKYYTYGQYSVDENKDHYEVDYRTLVREGRMFKMSLVLDDLSTQATRFVNLYGTNSKHNTDGYGRNQKEELVAGTALTITVTVSCPGNFLITQNQSKSWTTNSLYSDDTCKDEKGIITAGIHYGRHLQNLDVSSGVIASVKNAVQESDIIFSENANLTGISNWKETYSTRYFHGLVDTDANFKGIENENLESFTGSKNGEFYRISGLVEETDSNAGLFAKIAQKGKMTISDLLLTGVRIHSATENAAGIAGLVESDLDLMQCQTFLTSDDLKNKKNTDVWVQGKNVGGLVGSVEHGKVIIHRSASSSVLGMKETEIVGGLVGQVVAGEVQIMNSYADNYLTGKIGGGLIGKNDTEGRITSSYAAGFLTASEEGAGFACGKVVMNDSYTILCRLNMMEAIYHSSAKEGTANQNVYYMADHTYGGVDIPGSQPIGTMTTKELTEKLNVHNEFFTFDTTGSVAYNLMNQGLSTYPYPGLKVLSHYGDWSAEFQVGAMVYYEAYADGTYGFYGANVESTLRDDVEVNGDGYGVVYEIGADQTPSKITVQISDGKTEIAKEEISIDANHGYVVEEKYRIYPFSKELVNVDTVSKEYYLKATVTPDISTIQTDAYYFNPHFAKNVIYLLEANAGAPALTKESKISIRTARHLYNLSLYFEDGYVDSTAKCEYLQERNIDYKTYRWEEYYLEKAVKQQEPIGKNKSFKAIYNGQCYFIRNISFVSEKDNYVGFFGNNAGTVKNVVLRADYHIDGKNNYYIKRNGDVRGNAVFLGIFAGSNEGNITNCAVAGYYVAGSDGTIHAYENSQLFVGGFVGLNTGSITSCSADCPNVRLSSTFASVCMGGFVGFNNGYIANSYDLGHLEVAYARGGKVAVSGFAAKNAGIIHQSYCATAITASGETSTTYGFAPSGGSVADCNYLSDGTFSYVKNLYSYDFDNSVGVKVTFENLCSKANGQKAVHSYDFDNTISKSGVYPFRAVVKNSKGQLVHYGDWLDDARLGTVGIFYWEHEQKGSNNGYHFTYLGKVEGEGLGGTSLCTSHDDGGIITEYGYGYFVEKDVVDVTSISGISFSGLGENNCNKTAKKALDQQLSNYSFFPYTTRKKSAVPSGQKDYVCLNGTEVNDTWVISYRNRMTEQTGSLTYKVSPFFANAMQDLNVSVNSIRGTDGNITNYAMVAGTGSYNPYEIRSITQLQYINWNVISKTETDITTKSRENDYKFPFECNRGADQIHYSQTHDLENDTDANGNLKIFYPLGRGARSFKEHYNGNSYRITNIYINMSTSNYVGLFGELGGGTVLENVIMYADNDQAKIINGFTNTNNKDTEPATGALAGMVWVGNDQADKITISNCTAAGYTVEYNGQISYSGFKRYISVGGLIGSIFSGSVENCSAVNTVTVTNQKAGLYGRQQLGGLIGTAGKTPDNKSNNYSSVTNCYSGGKLIPYMENGRTYLCGGLIGNGNGRDKSDDNSIFSGKGEASKTNSLYGLAETVIKNCYTYCDIEKSVYSYSTYPNYKYDGYYYIAPNILNAANVQNCYYLKLADKAQATNINNVGTGYDYNQMSGRELIENLEEYSWMPVTTKEGSGQVPIHGKYSFPGKNQALEGKDYPFPTIIVQPDYTFGGDVHVHYGEWPVDGLQWTKGRTSMDIFRKMDEDGYATDIFFLKDSKAATEGKLTKEDFQYGTPGIAEVTDCVWDAASKQYVVTVKALNIGTTVITVSGTTADFTLEITADIQLSVKTDPDPMVLSESQKGTLTLIASTDLEDAVSTKYYETSASTNWDITLDQESLVEVKQKNKTNAKNVWNVTRISNGEVLATIAFRYDYHGVILEAQTYASILQTDLIGLTDGHLFNQADLQEEGEISGKNTTYSKNPPFAKELEEGEYFLYLKSKDTELSDMNIYGISVKAEVNGKEEVDTYHTPVSETENRWIYDYDAESDVDSDANADQDMISHFHVEIDKEVQNDDNYQYLIGSIYYKSEDDLEPIKDVTLEITLENGAIYTLSIPFAQIPSKKEITVHYLDDADHLVSEEVLSGTYTIKDIKEILEQEASFEIPEGKLFTGWKVSEKTLVETLEKENYAPGDIIELTDDIEFQPVWKLQEYKMTFDPAEGNLTEGKDEQIVTIEDVFTFPNAERKGYEFSGWRVEKEEDLSLYQPGDSLTEIAEDMHFIAEWTPVANRVTYELGSEEARWNDGSDGTEIVMTEQTFRLPSAESVTRPGYLLIGWKYEEKTYAVGVSDVIIEGIQEDRVYLAEWIKVYRIHFAGNAPDSSEIVDTLPADVIVRADETLGNEIMKWKTPICSNYIFAGWAVGPKTMHFYETEEELFSETPEDLIRSGADETDGTVTLYAKWYPAKKIWAPVNGANIAADEDLLIAYTEDEKVYLLGYNTNHALQNITAETVTSTEYTLYDQGRFSDHIYTDAYLEDCEIPAASNQKYCWKKQSNAYLFAESDNPRYHLNHVTSFTTHTLGITTSNTEWTYSGSKLLNSSYYIFYNSNGWDLKRNQGSILTFYQEKTLCDVSKEYPAMK